MLDLFREKHLERGEEGAWVRFGHQPQSVSDSRGQNVHQTRARNGHGKEERRRPLSPTPQHPVFPVTWEGGIDLPKEYDWSHLRRQNKSSTTDARDVVTVPSVGFSSMGGCGGGGGLGVLYEVYQFCRALRDTALGTGAMQVAGFPRRSAPRGSLITVQKGMRLHVPTITNEEFFRAGTVVCSGV